MNRRSFIFSSVVFAALMPLTTLAGKGWCRSEPIVQVDGQMYSITGFANARKAQFVYEIFYRDTASVIMSLPNDEVIFTQSGIGFDVEVQAFVDGQEVESRVVVKEIGS